MRFSSVLAAMATAWFLLHPTIGGATSCLPQENKTFEEAFRASYDRADIVFIAQHINTKGVYYHKDKGTVDHQREGILGAEPADFDSTFKVVKQFKGPPREKVTLRKPNPTMHPDDLFLILAVKNEKTKWNPDNEFDAPPCVLGQINFQTYPEGRDKALAILKELTGESYDYTTAKRTRS